MQALGAFGWTVVIVVLWLLVVCIVGCLMLWVDERKQRKQPPTQRMPWNAPYGTGARSNMRGGNR